MARYSRYSNHGSKPFPEYSILPNNWLIIYEAISKGRAGNDHLPDLVNFFSSFALKCLISEKMIPLSYIAVFRILNGTSKSNQFFCFIFAAIYDFSQSPGTKIHCWTFIVTVIVHCASLLNDRLGAICVSRGEKCRHIAHIGN